jgi:putative ABC transport system permease protein
LKPGATIEQAQAQVDALNATNLERFPELKQILIDAGFNTKVDRLQDVLVASVRPTLYFLWGGGTFLLLIGGVNVANLALARSNLRLKELSTRLALGAARTQVARQLVIESLVLAAIAGTGSILVALAILRALQRIGIDRIPRAGEIHMDLTVVGVTAGVSLITGVLIGLVPVAHLWNINIGRLLHEEGRTGTGGRKARAVRRFLVVAQIAFAFVLLIGSGLLLASFRNLLAVDPGFNPQGVIAASVAVPHVRYATDNDARGFTERALNAIRSIPGVVNAGATTIIPLGGNHSDSVIFAEGHQAKPGESVISPLRVIVTPGYFETMRTSLIRGRYFTDRDNEMNPGVLIIDQRLAERFWLGKDPIGRRMYRPSPGRPNQIDENTKWLTVVGVVREVQLEDLAGRPDSAGASYSPAAQEVPLPRALTFAIRTKIDSSGVLKSVRAELSKIDPAMPLSNVRTMNEYVAQSLMPRKAAMILAASFGLLSLFLSAVGIYGVLAYLATQRSREIGIRIALGSTNGGIFKLIMREGLLLVTFGLAIGLAGAFALRRLLQTQLYGLGSMDPFVIGSALVVLAAVSLVACAVPARRTTRVEPAMVLNQQ